MNGTFFKIAFKHYRLAIIICVSLIFFTINLQKPYIGHHDFNSSFFSIIARNLSRYSFMETKLGQVLNTGEASPNEFSFYTHNSPLYSWVLATDFKIFGVGELQARSLSLLFTLGILILIYAITKKIYSEQTAHLASLFFAFSAIAIYFSTNVFPDLQGIFLSLLAYLTFLVWLDNNKIHFYLACLVLNFLSYSTIWGSYFLTPFLIIYYLLVHNGKTKCVVPFVILPFASFGVFLIHNQILQGHLLFEDLKTSFLSRTNIAHSAYSVPLGSYIRHEVAIFLAYYSKLTALLALIWILFFLKKIRQGNVNTSHFKLLILLFWGLSYILFFRQASYIHDYFLIYLAPFVSIAAADIIESLYKLPHLKRVFQKYQVPASTLILIPLVQLILVTNYSLALLKGEGNLDGYIFGSAIKKETAFSDKVLVLSREFGDYFGVFTSYYSDRSLSFQDLHNVDLEKIEKNYNYVVLPEGRKMDLELKNYLLNNRKIIIQNDSLAIIKL